MRSTPSWLADRRCKCCWKGGVVKREPISVELAVERFREAEAPDPEGESFNDGDYFLYLNVTNQRARGLAGSKNWMSSIG